MVNGLNNIINNELPGCPTFHYKKLSVNREYLDFYSRNVLECICGLYGDPQFAHNLVFAPEWHYTSHKCANRMYNKMYVQCLKKLIKCFALSQHFSYISRNSKVKVIYLGLFKSP